MEFIAFACFVQNYVHIVYYSGSAGVIASGVWYLFNIGFGCGICLRCETKSLMNGTSHVQGYINLWLYVLINIPFRSLHLIIYLY
jgi:hypothetical protein